MYLDYITDENLKKHIAETIKQYDKKLEAYSLKKFNENIVDPIKLLFDKSVYRLSWIDTINNEIFRQRDKATNNDIGYFHQRIFAYMKNCEVPNEGWDVIFRSKEGVALPDGDTVHTIYVEMKNKHNTMNSAASSETYDKMKQQLLDDDDCACFLVEAIAKKSQNIKWEKKTRDGKKASHKRIRRVSLDCFYEMVTGDPEAFFKLCTVLPDAIHDLVAEGSAPETPDDTAILELREIAESKNISIEMALFLLGFHSYIGFERFADEMKGM
ncbi:MAG: Eco47II family restriction endonuclease [Clostridiales Family XIII bacterium]|jgi:hypothetical protein|nr:Eco47II family restriction endonuclease [Clostridiales Family XIII bacterium]